MPIVTNLFILFSLISGFLLTLKAPLATNQNELLSTSTPQPKNNSSLFNYPRATPVQEGTVSLILKTKDNPQTVTSWYREKVNSLDFPAKTISQTNTNGNVYNKLTAAGENRKIEVVISKKADEEETTIQVNY